MKLLFLHLFFILLTLKSFSHQTSCDINLSPQCGAENLYNIHYNIGKIDSYLLEGIKQNSENNWKASVVKGFERWAELSFVWQPLNSYLITVQHEFFGHGYRIRDFGKNVAEVEEYKVNKPYPYGNGGGYTSYSYKNFTPFHETAISIAGTEATSILSKEVKMNWLKKNKINPLETSLYLDAFHDLTIYILGTNHEIDKNSDGNDIVSYIEALEEIYPDSKLSLSSLQQNSLINLLDPFTYLSIYSSGKYIFTGKSINVPMIKIKNIKFLPSAKLGLSPFGPETYFENYFVNSKGPIHIYYKHGKYWENKYFGIGIHAPFLLVKEDFSLGMKCDLWNQPHFLSASKAKSNYENVIFYNFNEYDLRRKRTGVSLSLIANYKVKNVPLFIESTLGYKTKGFVPGESLNEGPIIRLGINGNF